MRLFQKRQKEIKKKLFVSASIKKGVIVILVKDLKRTKIKNIVKNGGFYILRRLTTGNSSDGCCPKKNN